MVLCKYFWLSNFEDCVLLLSLGFFLLVVEQAVSCVTLKDQQVLLFLLARLDFKVLEVLFIIFGFRDLIACHWVILTRLWCNPSSVLGLLLPGF